MDLSCSILDTLLSPRAVVSNAPERSESASPPIPWTSSSLNPKNRLDSFAMDPASVSWRIDGVAAYGTQFFAIPTCLFPDLVPLRVDLFIPDQEAHPMALRQALQSSSSVYIRNSRLPQLGIFRHLCRALENYCLENPSFFRDYKTLPFGSRLVFENIAADVKSMRLAIAPAHDLERQSLSVAALQKLWEGKVPKQNWPGIIDISQLRLVRQVRDTISVVCIIDVGHERKEDLIFKSTTTDFSYLYHELQFLLTVPRHPNIMTSPILIVTKKSRFGGKRGIYGFVLPYYPLGSIRDIFPVRTLAGTLALKQQFKWSRQVTSALIHIQDKGRTFYSDLRPDNVLLSSSELGGYEDIVLIDFEQRGNWFEWCAPEVLYRSYLENLSSYVSPSTQQNRWHNLVKNHALCSKNSGSQRYNGISHGGNLAWFSLSHQAQEKAEVYSLGLFLYCVFEGLPNVKPSIFVDLDDIRPCVANGYPYDPNLSFPEFRRTPPRVRDLIRKCTIDAPEWEQELVQSSGEIKYKVARKPVRVGDKMYPSCIRNVDGDSHNIAQQVWDEARAWWETELGKAEDFLGGGQERTSSHYAEERPTLRAVLAMLEHIEECDSAQDCD